MVFMTEIIEFTRSVIPACDVNLKKLEELVRKTADIEKISAYKIGFSLALRHGLPKTVETIRSYSNKPIIYDHQKAGTDIPDTGKDFAVACREAGINAAILFPQAGPETEKVWIKELKKQKLGVIIGGFMTHKSYSEKNGGFLTEKGIYEMYLLAAKLGVKDFVVPGNKLDELIKIKKMLEKIIEPVFYSPGLITQGGELSKASEIAGRKWHAIIGRALYNSKNIKKTALELTSKI